jgi:hypothetical protein
MLSQMTMRCVPHCSCCENQIDHTLSNVAQAHSRIAGPAMGPGSLQWDMLADDTWAQVASHLDTRNKFVSLCRRVLKKMLHQVP